MTANDWTKMTSVEKKASNGHSTTRASLAVSAGILLSRILGLVREQVFAHYLGNSDAAGAFRAALRIPNFLQNLFGEGVLSASFIPVYSRLKASENTKESAAVAGVVGSLLSLGVSLMVLLGVGLTPWFVDLVAPGFSGDLRELTVQIVRILFPGVGLLVLSAWCLGILNSHRRFFLSYVAPVFWNLAMIASLLLYGRIRTQNELVICLAWGSVIGSFLQLTVQLPFVFQVAGPLSFHLRSSPAVREVFRNLGPVLISRGVVQLSAYIDGMIASFLGAAAVASLGYAQTLYLLPISLFGMAVAAAELPEMSATAADTAEANQKMRVRLENGRRRISFFVIPSVVAFLFLGRQLIALLFETGKFGPEDTVYVWYILMGSVVGLLAATWGRLYSSAFYARGDTRTPLAFAVLRVVLTIVLGLLFAFPLRHLITGTLMLIPGLHLPKIENIEIAMGAVGLTSSAGLAGWLEFSLLKRSLDQKIGRTQIATRILLRVWASALIAAFLALGLALGVNRWERELFPDLPSTRWLNKGLQILPLVAFAVIYLGLTWTLKVSEFSGWRRKVTRAPSN